MATAQLIRSWLTLFICLFLIHAAWMHMSRRGPTPGRRRYKSCTNTAPKAATFPCTWWRRLKERLTSPASSSAWKSETLTAQVSYTVLPSCCVDSCPSLDEAMDDSERALVPAACYLSCLFCCQLLQHPLKYTSSLYIFSFCFLFFNQGMSLQG